MRINVLYYISTDFVGSDVRTDQRSIFRFANNHGENTCMEMDFNRRRRPIKVVQWQIRLGGSKYLYGCFRCGIHRSHAIAHVAKAERFSSVMVTHTRQAFFRPTGRNIPLFSSSDDPSQGLGGPSPSDEESV